MSPENAGIARRHPVSAPIEIGTSGIVVNERGELLLIQRNDSRTWALPGGSLEPGELPPDGAARELLEETGLQSVPVRLVGLVLLRLPRREYLQFDFRCLVKGGSLTPSAESPRLGYFRPDRLPAAMFGLHRWRAEQGMAHRGGPPLWQVHRASPWLALARDVLAPLLYRGFNLARRLRGERPVPPPQPWQLYAYAIVRRPSGERLWLRPAGAERLVLPGGARLRREAPWQTVVRCAQQQAGLLLQPTDLLAVYVNSTRAMSLYFAADVAGPPADAGSDRLIYLQPGREGDACHRAHLSRLAAWEAAVARPAFLHEEMPAV